MELTNDKQFLTRYWTTFASFTLTGLAFLIIREALQFFHEGWRTYLRSLENWLDISTIGATLAMFLCAIHDKDSVIMWASWACCIAWLKLSYGMINIPSFGGYLFLLCQMAKKVFLYILMFLPIIIGFALKFHLTLSTQESFSDFHAIPKVIAMMTGEFEYSGTFLSEILKEISKDSKPIYRIFREVEGNLSFVLFTVVCHIVLVNALIGLSVNVTREFRTKAESIRLARIAHHIGSVQTHLKWNIFARCFAKKALQKIDKAIIKPNAKKNGCIVYIPSIEIPDRSRLATTFFPDPSRIQISRDIVERTVDILKQKQEKEESEDRQRFSFLYQSEICQKIDVMDSKINALIEAFKSQMAQIQKIK